MWRHTANKGRGATLRTRACLGTPDQSKVLSLQKVNKDEMADYQVKVAGDPVVQQPTQTSDAENYVLNLDHEEVKSKS